MNRLTIEKQAQIIACLVEGNSLRSTGRILDIRFTTVLRNLVWIGEACQSFHDARAINLRKVRRIEADELWSFIHCKDKNVPDERKGVYEVGTFWTWISLCPDSRFVINWHIGKHEPSDAETFANDLAGRIPDRVQISTDQLALYRPAFENAFGDRLDYATVRKLLKPGEEAKSADGRFEQPELDGMRRASVFGDPDPELLSTASVESMNSQIRNTVRRYARATKGFSRKLQNKKAALALNFVYHNYCRIAPQIRCTPAMELGILDHVVEIEELLRMLAIKSKSAPAV